MALYKQPIPAILEAIRLQNGVELVQNEYTYGSPTNIPVENEGLDNMVNTSMLITALNPGSPYDGQVTVKIRRLDLSDLIKLVPMTIRGSNLNTTLDVALRLNKLYGTNFTADDIESTPTEFVDGSGTCTLVAKSGSAMWTGSVDVTVVYGAIPIETVVTVTKLPGLPYPAADASKPFAWAYSYWRDLSSFETTLQTVEVGTDSLQDIRDVLFANTGDAWVVTGAARFSLDGANVTYHGDTSGNPEANPEYDKVIVVAVSPTLCLGWAGDLYLHYNLPEAE